jgi:hypothetical protein
MVTDLARDIGAPDPEALGCQLHVLCDGAGLTARMDREPAVAADVRNAADAMIDRAVL